MKDILIFFYFLLQLVFGLKIEYTIDSNITQLNGIKPVLNEAAQILSNYAIKPLGENDKDDVDLEVTVKYAQSTDELYAWAIPDFSSRNKIGRPLRGTIIFHLNPSLIYTPVSPAYLVVHELLHIMVFEETLLSSFTNISDGYLRTPIALRVAKEHFNCNILDGVLLHGPHLDQSPYMEDIIVPQIRSKHCNITPITLAVLKDSGWWDVDENLAKHSKWGHGWGCNFAMQSCYNTKHTYPFCKPSSWSCTYDNKDYGYCSDTLCPTILETKSCNNGCTEIEGCIENAEEIQASHIIQSNSTMQILQTKPNDAREIIVFLIPMIIIVSFNVLYALLQ